MKNLYDVLQKYGIGFRNREKLSDFDDLMDIVDDSSDVSDRLVSMVNETYPLIVKDLKVFTNEIGLNECEGILKNEWSGFAELEVNHDNNGMIFVVTGPYATIEELRNPIERIIFLEGGIEKYPDPTYQMKCLFDEKEARAEKIEQVSWELFGLIDEYSKAPGLIKLYKELLNALEKDLNG